MNKTKFYIFIKIIAYVHVNDLCYCKSHQAIQTNLYKKEKYQIINLRSLSNGYK